jgi:hypothetical protein
LLLAVAVPSIYAQDSPTAWDPAVLTTGILTPADVPTQLDFDPRSSGPIVQTDIVGYSARYEARGASMTAAPGELLEVISIVTVFTMPTRVPDPLEEFVPAVQEMLFGLSRAGEAVGAEIVIAPQPVGEDRRALAVQLQSRGQTRSAAYVLFRREGAYVYLSLMATGGTPPVDEALRLAQLLDSRLIAAIAP